MKHTKLEMNFCRRCGAPLTNDHDHVFRCKNGHLIYANASPATAAIVVNPKGEVLVVVRNQEPHVGALDLPGGFSAGEETLEDTVTRELQEEIGLAPAQYYPLQWLCSKIGHTLYLGEEVPSQDSVFVVRLRQDVPLKIENEEISEVFFVPPSQLDLRRFCFPSVRQGLEVYLSRLDKSA